MGLAIIDLAEFICESDLIEGIHDNQYLLMHQIQARKKRGHVGAMLMLEELVQAQRRIFNVTSYITKELICKIQGLITAEQHKKPGGHKLPKKFVGQYRSCGVKVGNEQIGYRTCPPPNQVPELMEKLLQNIHQWLQMAKSLSPKDNLIQIADFHLWFLIIHPFADGNGRTARALAYYMLLYAGLKPIIFTNCDKRETYYPCFDNPKDSSVIRRYFFSKMGFSPDILA